MTLSKTKKEELKKLYSFNLKDINNKIISYKNDNIKIPKDLLKDFISSELLLFIPLASLNAERDNVDNSIKTFIDYMAKQKITGIEYTKLINTLDKMKEENTVDKVLLLKDSNNNIFRLYIKILPPIAYNYKDVSFVINLTEDIIGINDYFDLIVDQLTDNIKVSFITRSWFFEFNYYPIVKEEDKEINKEENKISNINILKWIDIIFLSQIN